jgi:hypothetical protein
VENYFLLDQALNEGSDLTLCRLLQAHLCIYSDNGRLWCDHKRVPLWGLLDKFASVSESGVYSSPIKDQTERFATMIGTHIITDQLICTS